MSTEFYKCEILVKYFSLYFGFPGQLLFNRLPHTHYLSSGAGIIGQLLADIHVQSGLSVTPPQETKKKNKKKNELKRVLRIFLMIRNIKFNIKSHLGALQRVTIWINTVFDLRIEIVQKQNKNLPLLLVIS
jgi:hypothetical protein